MVFEQDQVMTIIALLVQVLIAGAAYYAIYRNSKQFKTQMIEQKAQKKESEEKEIKTNKKQKARTAYVYLNLIPAIIAEGFACIDQRSHNCTATCILTDYPFLSNLQVINDDLSEEEVMYLIKLFSLIDKTKMYYQQLLPVDVSINTESEQIELQNSTYQQLLEAFCNGFPSADEKYYAENMQRDITPFQKIQSADTSSRTNDYIIAEINSYFKPISEKLKLMVNDGLH